MQFIYLSNAIKYGLTIEKFQLILQKYKNLINYETLTECLSFERIDLTDCLLNNFGLSSKINKETFISIIYFLSFNVNRKTTIEAMFYFFSLFPNLTLENHNFSSKESEQILYI